MHVFGLWKDLQRTQTDTESKLHTKRLEADGRIQPYCEPTVLTTTPPPPTGLKILFKTACLLSCLLTQHQLRAFSCLNDLQVSVKQLNKKKKTFPWKLSATRIALKISGKKKCKEQCCVHYSTLTLLQMLIFELCADNRQDGSFPP